MVIRPGEDPKEKIVHFECTRLIIENRRLEAVKYYRDQTGVSLEEAKKYVDELSEILGFEEDDEKDGNSSFWSNALIGFLLISMIVGALILIGIPINLIFF